MEIYLKRNLSTGFLPADQSDLDKIVKLKRDEVYRCEIKIARNYEFLKKFMAMVKIGHDATQLDMPFDTYRHYVIVKAGFFKTYTTKKGVFYEPESIAFDKMSEERFEEVYNRVLDVILQDIGVDKQTIEKELLGFI